MRLGFPSKFPPEQKHAPRHGCHNVRQQCLLTNRRRRSTNNSSDDYKKRFSRSIRIRNDVTHCSECYREFLQFELRVRRQRKIRRERVRWGIAGAVLALALVLVFLRRDFIFGSKRPPNAELAYNPRIINIESMSPPTTGGRRKTTVLLQ